MIFHEYKISNFQYIHIYSENTRMLSSIHSVITTIPKLVLEKIRSTTEWEKFFYTPFQIICKENSEISHLKVYIDEDAKEEILVFDNYNKKIVN